MLVQNQGGSGGSGTKETDAGSGGNLATGMERSGGGMVDASLGTGVRLQADIKLKELKIHSGTIGGEIS